MSDLDTCQKYLISLDSVFNYWFYVPIVATHIGGVVGSTLYDLLIGWHIPDEVDEDQPITRQDNDSTQPSKVAV